MVVSRERPETFNREKKPPTTIATALVTFAEVRNFIAPVTDTQFVPIKANTKRVPVVLP